MQLTSSEDDFESLPLLHHPTMIWPQSLSPEWLAESVGQSVTDDEEFISIRSQKRQTFLQRKLGQGRNQQHPRAVRSLWTTNPYRRPIRNPQALAKELRKQWKTSSLQLSLPTGVLLSGQEFNRFFGEADTYRQRWGAPVYDWKALPVEEAERVKAEEELDDLLAEFLLTCPPTTGRLTWLTSFRRVGLYKCIRQPCQKQSEQ